MGESKLMVECRFCGQRHRPRFLCDPAKRVLAALIERGMSFTMPTLDFPEPIKGKDMGLGLEPGDRVLRQVVVMAGTCEVAGNPVPVIVLTGQDVEGQALPRWMYIADAHDMGAFRELVTSRIDRALAVAHEQRQGR